MSRYLLWYCQSARMQGVSLRRRVSLCPRFDVGTNKGRIDSCTPQPRPVRVVGLFGKAIRIFVKLHECGFILQGHKAKTGKLYL